MGFPQRLGIVAPTIAAGAIAVAFLVHTPFVREAVLRYALPAVEREYGVRVDADRLDYNIAALRIGVAGLRLASPTRVEEPFFTAAYLSATLSWSSLTGALAFDDISVVDATLFVRRHSDGTTNLPNPPETAGGEPPPLRAARIDVPSLAVDLRDDQTRRYLRMPGVAMRLTRNDGYIRLEREAVLRAANHQTRIVELSGAATFDGRALNLADFRVHTNEGSVQINGGLAVIAREPAIDITILGAADVTELAKWAVTDSELPRGEVQFKMAVAGPFDDIRGRLTVMSDRLDWQDLAATDIAARGMFSVNEAEIEEIRFVFEGGHVKAAGVVPFSAQGHGRFSAAWAEVDVASAIGALAPNATVLPAAVVSGTLESQGQGSDLSRWSGTVRTSFVPGTNRTGRVAVAGEAQLALQDGRWSIEARPTVGGVVPLAVLVRGVVESGAIDGTLHVEHADLTSLMSVLRTTGVAPIRQDIITSGGFSLHLDLGGTISAPTIFGWVVASDLATREAHVANVRMEVSGRPMTPRLEFVVDAPEATMGGDRVQNITAAVRLQGSLLTLDGLSAHQPVNGGTVAASGTYDFRSSRYTASAEGRQWRIAAEKERPVSGRIDLSLRGDGTLDEPKGTGHVVVGDARWAEVAIGDMTADLALDGQAANIEAHASEFDAEATARVLLDAPYVTQFDVRADRVDFARILQGIETPLPVTGAMQLSVRGGLSLDDWRRGTAVLHVAALDALAGELPLKLTAPAELAYSNERIRVERLEAVAGEVHLAASGDLPVFAPAEATGIVATITGDVADVARAAAATGLVNVPIAGGEGPVALLARIGGALRQPIVAGDLEIGPGSVALQDLPPITNLRITAHAEDDWIEVRDVSARYEGAELSATAKAPLALFTRVVRPAAPANAVIHARATGLTPAVLSPFVDRTTLEQLEGIVDATLDASAARLDLADVTGELRIDRLDVRIADLPITQRSPTRISARDGFARVEAWDWMGQGATLLVRGQVRLQDRQAALLANGVVDLRVLSPFVRDMGMTTGGQVEPRLSITGAIDNPRIDGDVLLRDGELRVISPRLIASELAARAVLTRTTARIISLTGAVNGGELRGSGEVEYRPAEGLMANVFADIRGMAVEFPQGLRSEVDAALALNGGSAPKEDDAAATVTGRVSGMVTVVRGTYREPMAVVTGLLAGLRTERLERDPTAPSALDGLALDVRVITDEDIIVDNNYARVQLGADLRAIGTAAAPALSGRAELREGGQLFVGRNVYTVNFGTVDFANPTAIEPILNVEAVTRAGGEDIEIAITGTADSPSVTLRSPSDPSLGQAELASLLLTGRRLEELAPDNAAFVGTQVLGNFSAEILGFASRAVGLDTLRLGGVENQALRRDPTVVATEIDPTTRLTFGKSLGSDVDVTFSQSLRDGDAQTWIVDYIPVRNFQVRVVSDDNDLRSYGFRHDVTFGAAPPPIQSPDASRKTRMTVTGVSVSGDLALPEARVRSALGLESGERFDFAAWQDDRERLEDFYRRQGYLTARVAPRRAEDERGVAVSYEIGAGPKTVIAVDGIDFDSTLRSDLERAWIQSVYDDFLADESAGIVRAHLARKGYLRPAITARVRAEGDTKTLSLVIQPGEQTIETTVRIEGADQTLVAAIVERLERQGLIDDAVSNPAAIEREIIEYLRVRGHMRARVMVGTPLFEEASAILPVRVEAGPAFSIATVTFEGAPTLPVDVLQATVMLDLGAPYDASAVEAARARLVARHRSEGFTSASVIVKPAIRDEMAAVDVVFVIDEGPRQVIGSVVVSGQRATDPDVVLRALDLSPGSPLRAEELLQGRTRIFATGLFRRIDVTAEAETGGAEPDGRDPTRTSVPMRIRVTVEEWPALRLRYGFVVAEERPETGLEGRDLVPGISADLTRRTIFGRPLAIGSALELQRREQRGRAFLNAPTFIGLPVESSLIAERSREEFTGATLVTSRTSLTWEQRTRIARRLSLSYAYTFERNHTFDTGPRDPFAPIFDLTINIARVNAAAAWDSRDDPSNTTRGVLGSYSFEFAPEAVGSDIRFVRHVGQGYYFHPWRDVVFASAGRVGVAVALGGQDLIPSERFFVGGSRTVRGVSEESLGPRNFFGDAVGGRLMVVLNQEARLPVYRWLRGVAFLDAGNVFARPSDASMFDLVGSIGFGFRLTTPVAVLRADYARTMWGTPEPSSRWTFGIGQAF